MGHHNPGLHRDTHLGKPKVLKGVPRTVLAELSTGGPDMELGKTATSGKTIGIQFTLCPYHQVASRGVLCKDE